MQKLYLAGKGRDLPPLERQIDTVRREVAEREKWFEVACSLASDTRARSHLMREILAYEEQCEIRRKAVVEMREVLETLERLAQTTG